MSAYQDYDGKWVESEDEDFGLVITEIGDSYPKVFYLVRQITGKSLKEVKLLLDSPSPIIASGNRYTMRCHATILAEVGAKTKMIIIDE
jgi:ribosomal protein L7/L12